MTGHKRAVVLAAALVLAPALLVASVTLPNSFVDGTVASAAQVNANMNVLAAAANDSDGRLTSLEVPPATVVQASQAAVAITDTAATIVLSATAPKTANYLVLAEVVFTNSSSAETSVRWVSLSLSRSLAPGSSVGQAQLQSLINSAVSTDYISISRHAVTPLQQGETLSVTAQASVAGVVRAYERTLTLIELR